MIAAYFMIKNKGLKIALDNHSAIGLPTSPIPIASNINTKPAPMTPKQESLSFVSIIELLSIFANVNIKINITKKLGNFLPQFLFFIKRCDFYLHSTIILLVCYSFLNTTF